VGRRSRGAKISQRPNLNPAPQPTQSASPYRPYRPPGPFAVPPRAESPRCDSPGSMPGCLGARVNTHPNHPKPCKGRHTPDPNKGSPPDRGSKSRSKAGASESVAHPLSPQHGRQLTPGVRPSSAAARWQTPGASRLLARFTSRRLRTASLRAAATLESKHVVYPLGPQYRRELAPERDLKVAST